MNIAKDGRFVCYGPAGGGYGNPLERDPAKVADDVLDEVISVETALKRDYGVVVSAKGVVDQCRQLKKHAQTASGREAVWRAPASVAGPSLVKRARRAA